MSSSSSSTIIDFGDDYQELPSPPIPRKKCAVAVFGEEYVIIAGGVDSANNCITSVCMYHRTSKQWTELASLNRPKKNCSAIVLYKKLYVIGGCNWTPLKDVEILDLSKVMEKKKNNTTKTGELYEEQEQFVMSNHPLPIAIEYPTLLTHDDSIYAIGGNNTTGFLCTVYRLDIHSTTTSLEWTKLPKMNHYRRIPAAGILLFVNNNDGGSSNSSTPTLIVAGGESDRPKTVETLSLDKDPKRQLQQKWQLLSLSSLPEKRCNSFGIVYGGSKFVVAGGMKDKVCGKTIWYQDFSTTNNDDGNRWTEYYFPPFPGPTNRYTVSWAVAPSHKCIYFMSYDLKWYHLSLEKSGGGRRRQQQQQQQIVAHHFGSSPEAMEQQHSYHQEQQQKKQQQKEEEEEERNRARRHRRLLQQKHQQREQEEKRLRREEEEEEKRKHEQMIEVQARRLLEAQQEQKKRAEAEHWRRREEEKRKHEHMIEIQAQLLLEAQQQQQPQPQQLEERRRLVAAETQHRKEEERLREEAQARRRQLFLEEQQRRREDEARKKKEEEAAQRRQFFLEEQRRREEELQAQHRRLLEEQRRREEAQRKKEEAEALMEAEAQRRKEEAAARQREEGRQRLVEKVQRRKEELQAQRRLEEERPREKAEALRRKKEEAIEHELLMERRRREEEEEEAKVKRQEQEQRRREEEEAEAQRQKQEAEALRLLEEQRRHEEAERRQSSQQQQLQPFLATLERAQNVERARTTGQSSTRASLQAERKSLEQTIASKTGLYDMPSIRAKRSAQSRLEELDGLLLLSSSHDGADSDLYPTVEALQRETKSLEQSIDDLMSLRLDDDTAIPILEGLAGALEAVNIRIKKENEDATTSAAVGSSAVLGPCHDTNDSQDIQQSRERLSRVMNDRLLDPVEVSISYLRLCTNNFQQSALGGGGFGIVFLGTDPALSRRFAVKRIDLPLNDLNRLQVAKKSVKKEVATLMRFRHPNIIALYGTNLSRSTTQYLVYELAEKGSVADLLRTEEGRAQFSSGTRLGAIFQTCRAVNFLHTGGCDNTVIYHRDIKSDNICLTDKDTAKVIDCGVAKFVAKDDEAGSRLKSVMTTTGKVRSLGTRGYMDLGYASGIREFDDACDVFSIGVTMAEFITGTLQMSRLGDFCSRYSFDLDHELGGDRWRVLKGDADVLVEWDDEMLSELSKLAVQCMSQSRADRPTMIDIVQKLCWLCHQDHLGSVHPASTIVMPTASSAIRNVPNCSLCNRQSEAVRCSEGHFTCVECLEDVVRCAMNNHELYGARRTSAVTKIRCPFTSCTSAPFQDHMLFGKVSIDLYNNLMQERSLCGAMNGAFVQMLELLQGMSLEMCQGFSEMNQNLDEVQMTLKQNMQVQEVLLKKISGGLSRSLQALAYVTAGETARCPRLVWLVPARTDGGTAVPKNPTEWAQSLFVKKYHIYLICQHSMTPVDPPLEISVHRKWLVQAAPALKASLMVLRTAATMISGLPFPIPSIVESGLQLEMENDFVGELLTDAARAALESCESSIFHGDGEVIDEKSREIQRLVGSAFRLIAEKANKPKRSQWKQRMVPVVNPEGTTIWVKKEYQYRYM